jgi:LysM repeat protein
MKRFLQIICGLFFVLGLQVAFAQTNVSENEDMLGLHKVKKGETLYRISRNYFLNESDIIKVNPGLTANNLKANQVLKITITVRNRHVFEEQKESVVK